MVLSAVFSLLLALLLAALPTTHAVRLLESSSLDPCMKGSKFSATLFNVLFTPDNRTLSVNIDGVSHISQNVLFEFDVLGYGYSVYQNTIDPCTDPVLKSGFCPMQESSIKLPSNTPLPKDTVRRIPNSIYYIPDLDGKVQVWINSTSGTPLACVEAELSNGKTVYNKAVGWVTAVIAGLGLIISAVTSGLGHSTTAAHVASSALSLFGYFQAQAMIGMTSVTTPPIVRSWTQNFQWSMGIIRVNFLQHLATWYQRATGGTPSMTLSNLQYASVQVQKRSTEALSYLAKRTNSEITNAENRKLVTVSGIERVGFLAAIERTNIFLTSYIFFIVFVFLIFVGVVAFKYICEALVRSNRIKKDKFQDFRNGWKVVLKGILYRIALIGFPQMVVLCFWETTKRDSAAEVVLAIITLLTFLISLSWAAWKVWTLGHRSVRMHNNPAYILYSDPRALNKWGFLYVQFKADMYYFIIPVLIYILVKGMFIAFGQGHGVLQAVALLVIEAIYTTVNFVMRPYMDRKTNVFNIVMCAINFLNALLLLFFSGVFDLPKLAIGIMGVLFFVINAVFALIILLKLLWSMFWALVSKNPDVRYQPMRDDRGSFIKSSSNLDDAAGVLDALGATARGDSRMGLSSPSLMRGMNGHGHANGTMNGHVGSHYYATGSSHQLPPRRRMDLDDDDDEGGGGGVDNASMSTVTLQSEKHAHHLSPPHSAPLYRGAGATTPGSVHSAFASHPNHPAFRSRSTLDGVTGHGGGGGGGGRESPFSYGGSRADSRASSRAQSRLGMQGSVTPTGLRGGGSGSASGSGGAGWNRGVGY